MWPWCKINDEYLETVSGGMIAGLEDIDGIVPPAPDPEPVPDPFPSPVIWVSPK